MLDSRLMERGSRMAEPIVLHGFEGLAEQVGQTVGTSSWHTVRQEDIDTFAKLTGDEQWIHTDPARAADGPYGTTIQHGFLTLGLATGLLWEVCTVDGFNVVLNYGLNKVRFPAPLRVDKRIRMHVEVAEVRPLGDGPDKGAEAVYRLTYEIEGEPKPCCVADLVFRYYNLERHGHHRAAGDRAERGRQRHPHELPGGR